MSYQRLSLILLSICFLGATWVGAAQPSQAQSTVNCQSVTDISSGECQVLLSLYQNNNGRNWVPYTNWLSNNQPCTWRGVMCANGHVVGLSLIYMDLTGNFPATIGSLSYLEILNLSNNQLYGPMPASLGNLRNLRVLALSYNQLSGGLPGLGGLSNLQELRVAGNALSGEVPASWGSLPNLQKLDIRDTQLSGTLPASLASLQGMTDLLFRNSLVCEPVDPSFNYWINRLKYLERNDNYCGPPPIPTPALTQTVAAPTPVVNVIRNGGFEEPGPEDIGVAQYWERFDNSNAHYGWYDEQWLEAVYSGEHSQLLEIYQVYGDFRDRVIAIQQTVEVAPHSNYVLTFHALMRSNAFPGDRNKGDYHLDWGVDYSGQANYEFIEQKKGWVMVDKLPEQPYLGSTNPETSDAEYLTFQRVRATIYSGESRHLTLFIRGVKKFPSNVEVNFNLDEVSLVGPSPNAIQVAAVVSSPAAPPVTTTTAITGKQTLIIAPVTKPNVPPASNLQAAQVARIIDGDTIELASGETIRYLGINTPERGQSGYDEAKNLNQRLVEGKTVQLEFDVEKTDQYGRTLAFVWADGVLVNRELLQQGWANTLFVSPNGRYKAEFQQAEQVARQAKLGIWQGSQVTLKITKIQANAPGDDNANPNGEWLEISNQGQTAVALNGYTVKDTANHIYIFGNFTLAAGAQVRLYSGTGQDSATALYWGITGTTVWNNNGDTAFLRDARGGLVDSKSY